MKVLATLVIFAAAVAAGTIATLTTRDLAPAVAKFYWDPHCADLAKTVTLEIDPVLPPKTVGGPYGSKSAMFVSTGGAKNWQILGGKFGDYVAQPSPGVCQTWISPGYDSKYGIKVRAGGEPPAPQTS